MSRKRRREESIIISLVSLSERANAYWNLLLNSNWVIRQKIEGDQIRNLRFSMETLPKMDMEVTANMSKEADRNDHAASHLQLGLLEKDKEFQLPAEATYTNGSDLNPLEGM